MKNLGDHLILKGIKEGNRVIIKRFYKENFKYVRGYILQNSGSKEDVEDVFQDALMLIYQKLESDSLELKASLRTYFFAVCKNLWKKRLRKKSKMITTNEVYGTSIKLEESILDVIESKEREHLYRKYFLQLSETCQKVLALVFEDKNMKEISEITGYAEVYTRKKKFECKKSLLERVQKDPAYHELKITTSKE